MIFAQCFHDITLSHGLVLSLFLAGLVGSFTHCAGMCSPFILAQTDNNPKIHKLGAALLLPYHLGRITTYVVLAILISSLINMAFVFSDIKTLIAVPMLVLAAVIFLISAFPGLSAIFPWATRIQIAVPYKFMTRLSSRLMTNPNILKRYGLGILLGFMPCGLVISALLASATASNVLHAALTMMAFGLGTMPALVLVAFGGQALKSKFPRASVRISQGAMVISSLWLFALAGIMIL